jgi:hypothetical protein|tara:strand:+ start:7392 stop:7577 length:186 start_codon:yes stop_codon:yes gene_type:complete
MFDKDKDNINSFFENFEEDVLMEMVSHHPQALFKMCALISLDLQLIKEGYYESISNWGDLC